MLLSKHTCTSEFITVGRNKMYHSILTYALRQKYLYKTYALRQTKLYM